MATIKDIIIRYKDEDNIFNEYNTLKNITKGIYDSFKKMFDSGKGYPLSTREKEYGILSNIMGLSTILELESMGIDMNDMDEEFKFTLEYVFNSVYPNGINSMPVYSATPYIDESIHFDSYVETASKVTVVMIDLRSFINTRIVRKKSFGKSIKISDKIIKSYDELLKITEQLLIQGINFLCNSVIEVNTNEIVNYSIDGKVIQRKGFPSEVKYRGWGFCPATGDDSSFDTSIYYTFHATNTYVELYNAYPEIMQQLLSNKYLPVDQRTNNWDEQLLDLNEQEIKIFKRNVQFIEKNIDIIDKFKIITSSSGRYIDLQLKKNSVDISFDYIKSGFKKVSFDQVMNFQDNNAVINTLFVVGILLNSGIDEDYESQKEDTKKWFYNQVQYSIDNIKKIYSHLQLNKQQDEIESFKIRSALLSEKTPAKYNDLVQKLRIGCGSMTSAYDLIPLLFNTYSLVFNYIIKYPQIDMVENLELLMEKCSKNEDWLWGDEIASDSTFNINNNLYSILALENFYKYYETYEFPLAGNQKEYEEKFKEKKTDYESKIKEDQKKLNDQKKAYDDLKKEFEEKKSALDAEVIKLASKTFEDSFNSKIDEYFENIVNELINMALSGNNSKENTKKVLSENGQLKTFLTLLDAFNIVHKIKNDNRNLSEYSDDNNDEKEKIIKGIITEQLLNNLVNN